MRARSGARVSLVTRPAQTRSHSALRRAPASSVDLRRVVGELAEEPRPARVERVEDGLVEAVGLVGPVGVGQGQVGLVGEVEARPSRRCRAAAPWPAQMTSPDAVSSSSIDGLVVAHAGGEHQRLQRAGGHGAPGELVDGGEHPVDAAQAAAPPTCCQAGRKRAQRRWLDGLDLLPQPGERAAAQPAQHLGVAPLGAGPRGAELPVEHPALVGEPLQGLAGDGLAQAQVVAGHVAG